MKTKVFNKDGTVKKVYDSPITSSLGEKLVAMWLYKNKIKYNKEKKFRWLLGINNGQMRLDFYLPDFKTAIEFDGVYHDTSEYQKKNDAKKNSLLRSNGIKLIRIHHDDIFKMDAILSQKLLNKKKKKLVKKKKT